MIPTLYILHSRNDEKHERALSKQLAVYERFQQSIRILRDRDLIDGGTEEPWSVRMRAVDDADIVVLLLTPDFWDDYDLALAALARGKYVVPVLVSPTAWSQVQLGRYKPVPTNERFIDQWPQKDAAWLDVAQALQRVWQKKCAAAEQAVASAQAAASPGPGELKLSARPPKAPPSPLADGEQVRILFVAANPSDTGRLQLTEEMHQVQERLLRSQHGARFTLSIQPELRANQLASALMRHRPHIIHFSGHGTKSGALMLVDPHQTTTRRPLELSALCELLHILGENLFCVVLNACYTGISESQGLALADTAGAVVGMTDAVDDQSAIEFSAAFYEALAFGRSVQDALELGKTAIDATGQPGAQLPRLFHRPAIKPRELQIFAAGSLRVTD